MLQFILGAIGVVALSEISKRGKMPMMAKGGRVGMIEKKAKKLLEDSIEYTWRSTDMGSGWYFTLESPLTNDILDSHLTLDTFDGYDMDEDWDSLSKEQKKYYYEDWKEDMFNADYDYFKDKMIANHLDDFIEYIQQAKEIKYAKGGGVGIDYNKFLRAKTDQYRKEGYGLIDAIDTAFRDLGLETEGKFEKREFDKVVASNPNVKKAWTNYKKESSIYVKDGYYVNPYQMEYAKGGVLKKYKYVPNRNVESVELSKGNKTVDVDGADILDGVYVRKGKYAKGGGVGDLYKIQQKYKYDLSQKWEDEKFQTGGRHFLTFKQAQDFKKKLQGLSSSMEYKVVKVEEKYAKGGNLGK